MYIERYRDVWPQIFDLAFGVIDFETVKVQKKILELHLEIYTLEQNRKKAERRAATRDEHIEIIVKHAKEFGLVDEALSTVDAYGEIEQLIKYIFKLWNNFFSIILSQGNHFQIIMLEHVSEGAWHGCEHVNLVEVFDGVHNALIPLDLPSE